MKLSSLLTILAGSGLLASASPLRVVMVSETFVSRPSTNNDQPDGPVADFVRPQSVEPAGPHRVPCGRGGRLSAALRNIFGFGSEPSVPHSTEVHILPFLGTPPNFVEVEPTGVEGMTNGGDKVKIAVPAHRHHAHHRHHPHHRFRNESFLNRVRFALTSLGPWEGRAVAFVLGCGIGVLIRMFWVLAIISYRSIRGMGQSADYDPIIFEHFGDAEEISAAPPTYVVDEKIPVVVDQRPVITGTDSN